MNRRNTQKHSRRLTALALTASIILAGCTAATTTPADLNSRLEAAGQAFDGRYEYMYIPSGGRLADEAFLVMSRIAGLTGLSDLARKLVKVMTPAETRQVRILVTGQSAPKTLRVVLDALSFYKGRQLAHLELLYLGEPSHEGELARELAAIGASFRFAPYQSQN